jgi:hypothetical protein
MIKPKDLGGIEKLPPRVGIVREFRRGLTQPPHKHHHHGETFAHPTALIK